MSIFYLGALALIIFSLIFALWPYFRRDAAESMDALKEERQATNVSSFRDHLSELDTQFAQGHIEKAQYEETKAELERSLLHDNTVVVENTTAFTSQKAKLIYWVLVFICLPVMVFYIYQLLGYQDSVVLGNKLAQKNALESEWLRTGDTRLEEPLQTLRASLVTDLEQHIADNPQDLDSHVLLAREAVAVGQFDKAINTYQIILEQQPTAAQMMAELAQTVFIQSGNRAVPIVGILADRALSIDADHVMALGLAGVYDFQAEDYPQAIEHWQRAIALQPANSPNAVALINGVDQARARLVIARSEAPDTESDTTPAGTATDATGEPRLTVAVSLDERVTTTPDASVFIYARAWQGAKVPLAISRVTVSQLPLTIELDNSMSMAPGLNLSTAEQVELIARVSASGTAIAQEGDWEASIGPVTVAESQEERFNLVIDSPYQP